ncbi:2-nitropropane dioxygenase [Arthrobacter sp. SPG23]|uniref:nitronate monooxygenase n=1 Tax=Arthrobacter sp. SPG23 TaxID=1610703 RepID=UPI0005BB1D6D|nr:nitronate monooxygenase [Arthrobacter sp. SPG23]KIS26539.1 2-nitropropane dioxygenase [Arthrobacter sp. SPG23]
MTDAIFGTRIIAAPMAGGTSTPRFVQAVHRAGGLGFLAAGYKTVAAMQSDIREVRAAGARFGLNLFVPDRAQLNPPPAARDQLESYRRSLEPDARRYGVALPGLRLDDDDAWQDKMDALLADPVEFVSFTFGLPEQDEVRALKGAGSMVIATVTSTAEAALAAERGADVLAVQHSSAGGHSAAFLPPGSTTRSPGPATTAELLAAVRSTVGVPLVAAGGIMDSAGLDSVLAAGATAAQLGTALLRSDESGSRQLHKDALASQAFTETRMTRAFTGRQARALANSFVRDHEDAPEGYPAIHHLTAPIRAAAAAAGDPERLNLWAGTGWRQAETGPVADIMSGMLGGSELS